MAEIKINWNSGKITTIFKVSGYELIDNEEILRIFYLNGQIDQYLMINISDVILKW